MCGEQPDHDDDLKRQEATVGRYKSSDHASQPVARIDIVGGSDDMPDQLLP
jgi:hypothetical protein